MTSPEAHPEVNALVRLPWTSRTVHLHHTTVITPEGFGKVLTAWPVTIVPARYGGGYEGGRWLAFPSNPDELLEQLSGWNDSDIECLEFWHQVKEHNWPIGRGGSPDRAYVDLLDRLLAAPRAKG